MNGKMGQTGFSAVGSLFLDRLLGRVITGRNGSGGWVSIDEQNWETSNLAETVRVAEIRKETRPIVIDG